MRRRIDKKTANHRDPSQLMTGMERAVYLSRGKWRADYKTRLPDYLVCPFFKSDVGIEGRHEKNAARAKMPGRPAQVTRQQLRVARGRKNWAPSRGDPEELRKAEELLRQGMTHDEPFQPDVVSHDEEAAETANAQAAENVLGEDQARQVLVPVPVVPPVEPTEPDAPAPAAPPADPGVQLRQMATPAVDAPPAVANSENPAAATEENLDHVATDLFVYGRQAADTAPEIAAGAEDDPDLMQQQLNEAGDALEPSGSRTRQFSQSTSASDRPEAQQHHSALETMWSAEGIGKIVFSGMDGWDGRPGIDAKYANLTP